MKQAASAAGRIEHLVHGTRRLGAASFANDLCGNAGYGHVVRHRLHHNGASGDAGTMADLDIAKDARPGSDQHATTDFRMALLILLARATKGHAVQDGDVILDDSGFTAHESCCVIE